jgi:small subunit ribosomal protein S2
MASQISLKELLEAGCHFGHQSRRWNPAMKPYLYSQRDGVHIFDLVKTREAVEEACAFMKKAAKDGKKIIYVATKRQAQGIVKEAAIRAGVYYVTERWLGGTLTNFEQIRKSVTRLEELKNGRKSGEFKYHTKREQVLVDRKIEKLERFLGGVVGMSALPEVMFVVDVNREKAAVAEAVQMGVTLVALIDSNGDPGGVDLVIPANDDAVKSVQLIVNRVTEGVIEGNH